MKKKSVKRNALSYAILLLIIFGIMYFASTMNTKVHDLTYSEFITKWRMGK